MSAVVAALCYDPVCEKYYTYPLTLYEKTRHNELNQKLKRLWLNVSLSLRGRKRAWLSPLIARCVEDPQSDSTTARETERLVRAPLLFGAVLIF
jgi:hypothetical protein